MITSFLAMFIFPGFRLIKSDTRAPESQIKDSIALFLSPVGTFLFGCAIIFSISSAVSVTGIFLLSSLNPLPYIIINIIAIMYTHINTLKSRCQYVYSFYFI